MPYSSSREGESERERGEAREEERERERARERERERESAERARERESERDCTAGYANWMAESSVGKKTRCCQNTGKGCAPPVPGCTPAALAPPPLPFDCTASYASWMAE